MSDELNRRNFIEDSGCLAASTAGIATWPALHPAVRTARGEAVAPSETIRVALIGCGGQGSYDLDVFMRSPEVAVAALCDVDQRHLNRTAEKVEKKYGKKPTTTVDFHPILERNDVDVVIIGTPDHWHAIPFVYACMAGKDVYCEKPLCHNIKEGRAMVNAARRYKRVSQIGTQQRSGEHFQKAVKLVQDGKLGKISLTRTWNFSNEAPNGCGKPNDREGVPDGVDYDRWLGPAPKRPFNRARFHRTFRWFYDYAAGMIGDWNVHLQDIIHWAMGVTAPRSVHAAGGKFTLDDIRDTPDTLLVTYEFDSPHGPFIQFYEMRKGNNHGIGGDPGHGMQFHGTDATLYLDRGGFQVIPEAPAYRGHQERQLGPELAPRPGFPQVRQVPRGASATSRRATPQRPSATLATSRTSWAGRSSGTRHPRPSSIRKVIPTPRPMPCSEESIAKGYELPKVEPA